MKKGGLGSRLLVAAWGIPHLLGLTWLGGWWTGLLVAVIAFIAQNEYYNLQKNLDRNPLKTLGLGFGLVVVLTWVLGYEYLPWIIIAAFLIISTAGVLKSRSHHDILATLGGICYIPLLIGSFVFIRGWNCGGAPSDAGKWLALCVWGAIWVGDTAAYAGGRLMGRHKLAPAISPNKTIEGFIFGFLGSVLFGLFWWRLGLVWFDLGLVVGITAGLFGPIGDLVESAMKRESGVKDTSSFLPGHGGILDRFDSLLFTAPVVAMYLIIRPEVIALFA